MAEPTRDRITEARQYADVFLRARAQAGPELRESVWSRSTLCFAIFDMLDIMDRKQLREFFAEGE